MGLATGRDTGYRLQGPVTNLAAAGVANAIVVFQISNFAQLVGTKSVIIKRIKMMNNALGNQVIIFGTGAGAGFAQTLETLDLLAAAILAAASFITLHLGRNDNETPD